MASQTPWVRVVIVNYNADKWLQATIDGLARQTFAEFEAVIVDNASTDGSIAGLRLPDSRFRLLKAGANIGFAAGCNLGTKGAHTPWLAMLNPDAVPNSDWLERLRAATETHRDAVAFGTTQLMAEDERLLDGGGDNYSIFGIAWRGGFGAPLPQIQQDIDVFSPCAAAALYRTDVYAAVDGFAETFFCFLEDVDLGFRLRLQGGRIVQVADAKVVHAGSAIAGRRSAFTIFHSTRNGVYMLMRCMPTPLLLLALPLFLAAQAWLMARTPNRWARLKGLVWGLLGLARARLWKDRKRILEQRRISLGVL
ncbi:MAG: glycosyltransferase family 2 protein, partial [Rhodospirillales bacterium]